MDALILAAGEGTRLRPLTTIKPKPLLPILNQPLLQWTLDYLNRFSIYRIILNTHHLAGQFETSIPLMNKGEIRELVTRYEPQILNTGGGLKNTGDFFRSDPFLVISGDILTDIDLEKALNFHQNHNDPVTLVLHDYPEFNQIQVDSQGRILKLRKGDVHGLDFANIHILDQTVFNLLPSPGCFDIIPAYQQMIDNGITIRGYISRDHYWRNIGTPATYLKTHEDLLAGDLKPENGSPLSPRLKKEGKYLIHPDARIEEGVRFSEWACIGKGCLLKKGCRLHQSVLWENVTVERGVSVLNSIVGNGVWVTKSIQNEIII